MAIFALRILRLFAMGSSSSCASSCASLAGFFAEDFAGVRARVDRRSGVPSSGALTAAAVVTSWGKDKTHGRGHSSSMERSADVSALGEDATSSSSMTFVQLLDALLRLHEERGRAVSPSLSSLLVIVSWRALLGV